MALSSSSVVGSGADIDDDGTSFFFVTRLFYQLGIAKWFVGDIVIEAVHVFNSLSSSETHLIPSTLQNSTGLSIPFLLQMCTKNFISPSSLSYNI